MIEDAGSDQRGKPDFCPYVGLAPFDHAHWDYYFGRELDASTLADNVLYTPATVLYGPSGIGKSSLINIGLPKELAKRRRGADVVVFRRWQRRNLSAALMAQISRTLCLPSMVLHEAPPRVSDFVRFVVTYRSRPLVIVLDQFEEYFVYRQSERDCQLEAELDQIIHEDALNIQLLFAIREDRYHLLDSLRLTIPAILDNTLELDHLNEEAVRAAIVRPLEVYNAQHRQGLDPIPPPGFVDRLISELRHVETGGGRAEAVAPTERPIELPYLQLALEKIWKAAGGAGMRVLDDGYPAEQRISHILADHLEKVMRGLTPEQQALCARLFERLITRSGTKFAMSAFDLAEPERGIQEDAVQDVLTRLSNQEARILTPVAHPGGAPTFEIFQDVLGSPILRWKDRFEATREAVALAAKRRRRAMMIFMTATILVGVLTFWPQYATWVEKRPWGYIRFLSTGSINMLTGYSITIGRNTDNSPNRYIGDISHNVNVNNELVSPQHLFLTKGGDIIDVRSTNGTTLNAQHLPYDSVHNIRSGDILVLAGVVPLEFHSIEYSGLPFVEPHIRHSEPSAAWGVLIDGARRHVRYLSAGQYFLSINKSGDISLSEKQTEQYLMLIRYSNSTATVRYRPSDGIPLDVQFKNYPRQHITDTAEIDDVRNIVFYYDKYAFQIVPSRKYN